MKRIIKDSEIGEVIKEMNIEKIAVAYIGKDYSEYIGKNANKSLKKMIVSATIGSNPYAIKELMDYEENCGDFEISFLNNLHAKIYWSKEKAIITSANLTRNGLSGEDDSLREIGYIIDDSEEIMEIEKIFDEYYKDSIKDWDTKENIVEKLKKNYQKAVKENILNKKNEYDINSDFEIALVSTEQIIHKKKKKEELEKLKYYPLKDIENLEYEKYIQYEFSLSDEQINKYKNKWVLNLTYSCCKNKIDIHDPYFIFVHDIIKDAVKFQENEEKTYCNLAVQWYLQKRKTEPFELNEKVQNILKKILKEDDYIKNIDKINVNELKKRILLELQ